MLLPEQVDALDGLQALHSRRVALQPFAQVWRSIGVPPAVHSRKVVPLHHLLLGMQPLHSLRVVLQPEVQAIIVVPVPSPLHTTSWLPEQTRSLGWQVLHSRRTALQPFAQGALVSMPSVPQVCSDVPAQVFPAAPQPAGPMSAAGPPMSTPAGGSKVISTCGPSGMPPPWSVPRASVGRRLSLPGRPPSEEFGWTA
jgi:hypothetical protein